MNINIDVGDAEKYPYHIWYEKGESALQMICRAFFLRRLRKIFCL